ncbi:MAG: redoxin domain-containing protein [Chloroflexi bacterium]|nr:redoxin domain-containing protein [Chloroflexota bacterium]
MEDKMVLSEERPVGQRGARYALFGLLIAAGIGAIVAAIFLSTQATGTQTLNPEGSSVAGRQAPDFTLKNLKGEFVSLRQFRGQPVLLFFWATW